MHIHILGICGTFMGGIAAIAKSLGHHVTGSDKNVYPPMSTQLTELGIELIEGYDPVQLMPRPDMVVVGNAMSRGNPCVEAVLNQKIPYTSGPQWLLDNFLKDKWVLAVSGTHGKTTTASMLAWILEYADMKPGYLIGGVPQNFTTSARVGGSDFFVIEADEYDTAFFDKRSKFVHYRPNTLIINNLEFDHADIFDDLAAIQKQFHHLMRMIPSQGMVITPSNEQAIDAVLQQGCWSETQQVGREWQATLLSEDGSQFEITFNGEQQGMLRWQLMGNHNVHNALMAIAAARHVGVTPQIGIEALAAFKNVKRRMELRGEVNRIKVYDDFAHHPTAITTTLAGLRAKVGKERILAVLEPRSNTMKMGVHKETLIASLAVADYAFLYQPDNIDWSLEQAAQQSSIPICVEQKHDELVQKILSYAQPGDHILIMSNGGFANIHEILINQLRSRTL